MSATNEELLAKIATMNSDIDYLKKAMQVTGDAPVSMQINYTPELKSKVFDKSPYFRFLESKGCVEDTGTTYAGFYKETNGIVAKFIDENDDIPDAIATTYAEETTKMKTIIAPIDVSLMSQMGNNTIRPIEREIEKGYIQVNNTIDCTLLQGAGTASKKDFPGFTKQVSTNVTDMKEKEISEDAIDDMLEPLYNEYNASIDCIVTSALVAKQLKKITAPYRRFNDKVDIGLGHRVNVYESLNGTEIPILVDSNLEDDSMMFVDSSCIEIKRLMPNTLFTDLPTNKLGVRQAIATFVTSQNIAEYRCGLIKNIGSKPNSENDDATSGSGNSGTGTTGGEGSGS